MAVLAQWMVALSQGLVFFHAGDELLRSKSLDRDTYDSGESNFGICKFWQKFWEFDSLLLSLRMCRLHLPSQFTTTGHAACIHYHGGLLCSARAAGPGNNTERHCLM